MKRPFLTDKDVMAILMVSRKTLNAALRDGRRVAGIDLRAAAPIVVSAGRKRGQRRWSITKFAAATGLSREDIWEALA